MITHIWNGIVMQTENDGVRVKDKISPTDGIFIHRLQLENYIKELRRVFAAQRALDGGPNSVKEEELK